MKPITFETDVNSLVEERQEKSLKVGSTITFNPLLGVASEDYTDSSIEQREVYLKSKCNEAEIIVLTLSKMFEGDILEMEIPELNLSVACILRTHKKLSSKECGHIMSISQHLEII